MELSELLDQLAGQAERKEFPMPPAEWHAGAEGLAARILMALGDRHLRPEHRQRIHEDLVANRAFFESGADERAVDLVVWSEHVESLYKQLKSGKLAMFHYARALEATCRRCGFVLLPLMGRVEELGQMWGSRHLVKTYELVSPHFE